MTLPVVSVPRPQRINSAGKISSTYRHIYILCFAVGCFLSLEKSFFGQVKVFRNSNIKKECIASFSCQTELENLRFHSSIIHSLIHSKSCTSY